MSTYSIQTAEERLLSETDSLGELMARFRRHAPRPLIGDQEWERILACARRLPVTLAAAPFGFELPLHDFRPQADLGISVVAGGHSGSFFGEGSSPRNADAAALPNIARMLDRMADKESRLQRIAGPKLMLSYDCEAALDHASAAPGLFLYPVENALAGGSSNFQRLGLVLDAIDTAAGRDADAAEREQVEEAYMALSPETCIGGIGTFPARGRSVRLTLAGFGTAHDIGAFLERAGCPEQYAAVEAIASFLAERDAFARLGIHLDMKASGIGPQLGLSFAQAREWALDGRHWTALIDGMRAQRLAVPDKLSALAQWSSGPEMLLGQSGGHMLIPCIHHVKYVLAGGQVAQVKAYVAWLVHFPAQTEEPRHGAD